MFSLTKTIQNYGNSFNPPRTSNLGNIWSLNPNNLDQLKKSRILEERTYLNESIE